jgi:hypothetical protein
MVTSPELSVESVARGFLTRESFVLSRISLSRSKTLPGTWAYTRTDTHTHTHTVGI